MLVSIDTLRADHVGCYGAAGVATPQLDTIAARGVRFQAAFSPVPLTLPAHTTLMTGRDPPAHGVRHNSIYRLAPTVPTLAGELAAAGYATAAFVGARVLERRFGLDQGFAVYDDGVRGGARGPTGFAERPADQVVDAALAWLAEAPERFFLWVHLYDPHRPYEPPPGFAIAFASRPYDGEIAFADAEIGRLLAAIRARFGDAGLLVVATADHGESLGEHGELTHGYSIYDATQHVPLLFAGPGLPAGRIVQAPVSLADVAPTLLALAGAGPLDGSTGRDLGPLLRGKDAPDTAAPVYLETLATQLDLGWSPLLALRTDRFKYVRAPRPELYDLAADPGETRDIAAALPDVAQRLDRELASRCAAPAASPLAAPLDAELSGRLRELGYLAAPAALDPARLGEVGGIDPKDGRDELARLVEAQVAAAGGRVDAALGVLRTLGDGPVVAAQRAAVAVAARDFAQAERDARLVLALQPEREDVRVILAQTLLEIGRPVEADAELARLEREAVAAVPWVALRRSRSLAAAGDRAGALAILAQASERHPEEVSLGAELGSRFEAEGRLEEALVAREASLARDPDSVVLQNDVAWTLVRLGRDLERARGLAEAAARARPGDAAILDTLAEIRKAQQATAPTDRPQ